MSDYQHIKRRIGRYLGFTFYRIEGYSSRSDAVIFQELIAWQVYQGIHGSLAEIGVHHGRSLFLLALGRSGSEKCLGVDLFEDDALYTSRRGIGQFAAFGSNCRRYQFNFTEDEIIKGNSLELNAQEIVSRVGKIRFFSIDGGHMYEHVTNDLRLAAEVLTPEGIICLDDVFSALWPEVAIATFDWIRTVNNRFVPFVATKHKLYLCHSNCASLYLAMIREDKALNSKLISTSIFSNEVIVLFPTVTSRVVDRAVDSLFSLIRS